MNLREFIKAIEENGFKVKQAEHTVDIEWKDSPCAMVSLSSMSECWVNTSNIGDEIAREALTRSVSAFTNTPLADRRRKMIAKHKNGSYVKEVALLMMGKPALRVEMTNNYTEANDSISSLEREWLNNFFGDKISYIEEH